MLAPKLQSKLDESKRSKSDNGSRNTPRRNTAQKNTAQKNTQRIPNTSSGGSSGRKSLGQLQKELDEALEKEWIFLDGYVRMRMEELGLLDRLLMRTTGYNPVEKLIEDAYETVGMNRFMQETSYLIKYIRDFYHRDVNDYVVKARIKNNSVVYEKYTS